MLKLSKRVAIIGKEGQDLAREDAAHIRNNLPRSEHRIKQVYGEHFEEATSRESVSTFDLRTALLEDDEISEDKTVVKDEHRLRINYAPEED